MILTGYSKGVSFAPYISESSFNHEATTPQETEVSDFLFSLNPEMQRHVEKLSSATHPIFVNNEFKGNAVAISDKLLLTASHCISTNHAIVGKHMLANVVFDGQRGNLDFKILHVPTANLTSINLDTSPGVGHSVQTYFKVNHVANRCSLFIKSFISESGLYAQRSDMASVPTQSGESGAPRMSLNSGAVHSIHQGNSEGLKVNDIYELLEKVAKKAGDPEQQVAQKILSSIHVENLEMRLMNWSPLQLQMGDVREEKARIGGSVSFEATVKTLNKKGKEVLENVTIKIGYSEVGEGRGNRWIRVYREGIQADPILYSITPNPHDNDKYNKDGQVAFYHVLASALKEFYKNNGLKFPSTLKVNALKQEYILAIIRKMSFVI